MKFHRSIHHLPLIWGQNPEATNLRGKPRHHSPQRHYPAPPGVSRGVLRPDGIHNPSGEFWVWPGASSQLNVSEKPPKATRKHPNQMNHLSWLVSMWRSSGSTPSSLRMVEVLPLSLRLSPAPPEGNSFQPLVFTTSFFGSLPRSVTIDKGWNKDGEVNWKLFLPAQLPLHHNGPGQRPHYCSNPSVHL